MKEAFLHYVWANQLFNSSELYTASNERLTVSSQGTFTGLDGPDFFNARLTLGTQEWAGNVEIHVNASDWYLHNHERDKRYENVVLHVVWEYDTPVFRADGSELSVFILKNYVDQDVLRRCNELFLKKGTLYCEDVISQVNSYVWTYWKERLFIERLEDKMKPIAELLQLTNNHWEHVFFCFLAKSFGLNANGEAFFMAVKHLPILAVYKQSHSLVQVEALLFGATGLLEDIEGVDEMYVKELKREWAFLKHKYNLEQQSVQALRFFQLRPPNFPTIRLAQLSSWLYHQQIPVVSILTSTNLDELYRVFSVDLNEYWQTHYMFNRVSEKKTKKLSKDFIDLIIINVVLPMQIMYRRSMLVHDEDISDILGLAEKIKPEKNSIVSLFSSYGVAIESAVDSQGIVHLKKRYCDQDRCLSCQVGKGYLKKV